LTPLSPIHYFDAGKNETTKYGGWPDKNNMVKKIVLPETKCSPDRDRARIRVCWGADKKKLFIIEIQ